ncbi:sodium:proton antiporter [Bacillus sp. SRB_336]|nr:sodium:proton antiporter [Bacillus sp. SRB_336]
MEYLAWIGAIGTLLLLTSLLSGWIHDIPITHFAIYLLAGIAVGPWGLDLVRVDLRGHGRWLSWVTEAALVVSLFITGLKMRLGFRNPAWRDAVRLAFPAMVLTVAGVSAAAHFWLALPWAMSLLIGALVAPTDPVLASIVAIDDARDADQMRAALSGEAGLNDGSALPFLLLALLLMASPGPLGSSAVAHWFAVDVLWSFAAGLALGFGLGWIVGLLGTKLRTASKDVAPSDFLALALMALAYAGARSLSASGFLAAFAAGLGLRTAELYVVTRHPHPRFTDAPAQGEIAQTHPPAEVLVNPNRRERDAAEQPAASVGLLVSDALSFGDTLERLIAFALVLLAGMMCARYWSLDGVILAGLLFVVIRPLSAWIALSGSSAPPVRRLLIGWIGIRGIGTLNYLAYAITHGLAADDSMRAAQLALTVVVLSILVHGVTAQPLMTWRRSRIRARRLRNDD